MNKPTLNLTQFFSLIFVLVLISCNQDTYTSGTSIQRSSDFNFDWKFALVEDTLPPSRLPVPDEDWRDVRLPHDWSVEFPFDSTLDGNTGYLPGGIGIYQKHFKVDSDPSQKSTYVLFDGVYNNATFWLNGEPLGQNPYGYSPVYFELTDLLKKDGSENIITVHVDRTRYSDSRWYTGSGIYRNVELITVDKLHIPIW
ncbi:MAG: sugar-binding domain-containing protein, partial [Bacteroidota bacterium]